jgi:hypothetical protein
MTFISNYRKNLRTKVQKRVNLRIGIRKNCRKKLTEKTENVAFANEHRTRMVKKIPLFVVFGTRSTPPIQSLSQLTPP